MMLQNDIASLAGICRHGAASKANTGGFVCVCLHIRAQLPCLLVSERERKGTASGHQLPLVKRYLSPSFGCIVY